MSELVAASLAAFWLGILAAVSPCPLATNVAAISYIGKDLTSGGRVVAYAEVEIDGGLLVRGLRVMETGSRGLFVGYPARRVHDGVDTVPQILVGETDHRARAHLGVGVDRGLHLRRGDVRAAPQDHVGLPVGEPVLS